MGSGASSGRVTVTTPVYKAYENSDERTEKYRHLVIVDDGPLDRDSSSYSRTPSLEFSVFDSNTVTDDSNSRDETDSLPSSSCSPRDLKRQRRVRFANVVTVSRGRNGSVETAELATPDDERELTSWDDGILERVVLRVDVEYGQTRSIRYDPRTSTVSDIIESLKEKLKFSSDQFLALSLVKQLADGGQPVIRVLRSDDNVHQKITLRLRVEEDLRCCLRVIFVPSDLNVLLAQDPEAFNYLYTQCCNDVTEERFAGDLTCNEVLDLAALQIVQWAYDERTKLSKIIKNIERSWELVPFVPKSLLKTMTEKQMRRRIARLVKVHLQSFEKSFQVKREYLRRIAQLPSFARRQFQLENGEEKILVGPKNGIEKMKDSEVVLLAKFTLLRSMTVDSRLQSMTPHRTRVMMELAENQPDDKTTLVLEVSLLTDDIDDFVVWVSGYYYLYTNQKLSTRVVLDDFHEDYNNGYAEYDGDSMLNSSDDSLLPLFYSGQRPTIISYEDLYNGPQVERSHLCQPLCGYCPAMEDVVNQLETVLPTQDGRSECVQPSFEYNDHQLRNSNELRETSGTPNRWSARVSQTNEDNGFHGSTDNYREITCHKDIGDEGHRNGFGCDGSEVDVSFRFKANYPGYFACPGAPSGESWNDEAMSVDEDTISCHLRRFFDDGESESFLPPPVESLASFLDNIPEPQLKDSDLRKFCASGSTTLILLPPVGFNDQMFPDGSHIPDVSDSVLPLDIPREERYLDHLTMQRNLKFSSMQNSIRLPSLSTLPPQLRTPSPSFPPHPPSLPSVTQSLSPPSPPPLPISFLPSPLLPLSPPSSPSVDLPTPTPFEYGTPSDEDWLLMDGTDELLNKLKIQYAEQILTTTEKKPLGQRDGKVFPGLDRL